MKSILASSLLITSGAAFAQSNLENALSNERLLTIAEKFNQKIADEFQISFAPHSLICGTAGCQAEIINNHILEAHDVYFSGKENLINGATQVMIEIVNPTTNQVIPVTTICLSNDECKFFAAHEQNMAEYAFQHHQFLSSRKKRDAGLFFQHFFEGHLINIWAYSDFNERDSSQRETNKRNNLSNNNKKSTKNETQNRTQKNDSTNNYLENDTLLSQIFISNAEEVFR